MGGEFARLKNKLKRVCSTVFWNLAQMALSFDVGHQQKCAKHTLIGYRTVRLLTRLLVKQKPHELLPCI